MYRRILFAAALLAGAGISISGTDHSALERASLDWDKGDYVAALTAYQDLLAGPDAAASLEPIALQTGELYRTIELTNNGANPVFSPDSRHFSFETGLGVSAGVASGMGRVTHVRAVTAPDKDLAAIEGWDASFCPDGRGVAFLRVAPTSEINAAQAALAAATNAQERAPRQLQLARLIARHGRIVV